VAAEPTGPARDAGIELGDVIVSVDGAPVKDTGDLMERVARKQPGERVALEVVRYGQKRDVSVRLASMNNEARPAAERPAAGEPAEDTRARLGFQATEMDAATARRAGLSAGGVVVTGVDGFGPAAGNVPEGLRIERINGQAVSSLADLRRVAAGLRAGQVVSLVGRDREGRQIIANYRLNG
jgi:serine protease Do